MKANSSFSHLDSENTENRHRDVKFNNPRSFSFNKTKRTDELLFNHSKASETSFKATNKKRPDFISEISSKKSTQMNHSSASSISSRMFSDVFSSPFKTEDQYRISPASTTLSVEHLKDSNEGKQYRLERTPQSDLSIDITSLQLPYFKFKAMALQQIMSNGTWPRNDWSESSQQYCPRLTPEQIKKQAQRLLALNVVTYRPTNSEISGRILSLVRRVLTFPLERQEQFIRSKEESPLCAVVKSDRERQQTVLAQWKDIYSSKEGNLKRKGSGGGGERGNGGRGVKRGALQREIEEEEVQNNNRSKRVKFNENVLSAEVPRE